MLIGRNLNIQQISSDASKSFKESVSSVAPVARAIFSKTNEQLKQLKLPSTKTGAESLIKATSSTWVEASNVVSIFNLDSCVGSITRSWLNDLKLLCQKCINRLLFCLHFQSSTFFVSFGSIFSFFDHMVISKVPGIS